VDSRDISLAAPLWMQKKKRVENMGIEPMTSCMR